MRSSTLKLPLTSFAIIDVDHEGIAGVDDRLDTALAIVKFDGLQVGTELHRGCNDVDRALPRAIGHWMYHVPLGHAFRDI